MLQYALNDAKIVVNLFLVYKKLADYITNNEDKNLLFENMILKFSENRENIKSLTKNKNFENCEIIFPQIYEKCLELIKQKLKDKYLKLSIFNVN
jgi:hypothetical protein